MEVGTSTVSDSSPETGSLVHAVGDEDATFTYFSAFSPCCRPDLADPPKGIDIEKVDGGLEITAEGPGSCQITISSTDVESSILPVAVYMKPATLEVSPSTVSLEVDGTATRPPRRSLNDDVFRKRAARGKLP